MEVRGRVGLDLYSISPKMNILEFCGKEMAEVILVRRSWSSICFHFKDKNKLTVQSPPGESALVRKCFGNYLFYADENEVEFLKSQFTILQLHESPDFLSR